LPGNPASKELLRCIVIDAFEINLNRELVEYGIQFAFRSYFLGCPSASIR